MFHLGVLPVHDVGGGGIAVARVVARWPVGGGQLIHKVLQEESSMVDQNGVQSEELREWNIALESIYKL